MDWSHFRAVTFSWFKSLWRVIQVFYLNKNEIIPNTAFDTVWAPACFKLWGTIFRRKCWKVFCSTPNLLLPPTCRSIWGHSSPVTTMQYVDTVFSLRVSLCTSWFYPRENTTVPQLPSLTNAVVTCEIKHWNNFKTRKRGNCAALQLEASWSDACPPRAQ